MTGFLALPNESMLQITGYLHPSAIVPFALTCKRVHSVSHDALQRHAALREQYSVLHIGISNHSQGLFVPRTEKHHWHPIKLLSKILDDPGELAYYPVAIEIEPIYDNSTWFTNSRKYARVRTYKEALLRIIDTHSAELSRLVLESPFITAADRREHWLEALTNPEWFSTTAFVAILLNLLPNLKSLTMTERFDHYDFEMREMVSAIAKANCDPTSPGYSKALINLKQVTLGRHSFEEEVEVFALYGCFAALPSMYSLYGDIDSRNEIYAPDLPAVKWQVKEIEMVRCAVRSASFDFLLRNIEKLERFTYNHHCVEWLHDHSYIYGVLKEECVPYKAFKIVDLLDKYARHSLETLDLAVDEYEPAQIHTECEPFIGSLKHFNKLRMIRLDDYSFEKSVWVPRSFTSLFDGLESSDDDLEDEVARVVDVLPASVRVLTLVPKSLGMGAEAMFRDFVQEKKEMLPELREIIWEGECPLNEEMRKQIKGLGIVLNSYQEVL